MNEPNSKPEFLYPRSKYRGKFTPENLTFNDNLQEFAQQISLICGLESGGKIPPQEAYSKIKSLWKQLKVSKQELLDQPRPPGVDLPPE